MDFKALLEDLKARGMGIQFGKLSKGKQLALEFKAYAISHGEKVHVILDERKNWAVITDYNYQRVNDAWKKRGGMKSY